MIILFFDFIIICLSLFIFGPLQTQHALQDPGASEAAHGSQWLHDQPRPTRQPARTAAEPRAHGVAQPEATHAQVDEERGEKSVHAAMQELLLLFCIYYCNQNIIL